MAKLNIIQLIAIVAFIAAVPIAAVLLTGHTAIAQSGPEAAQFNALSQATTDQCAYLGDKTAIYDYVDSQANDTYFQGSCCTPMVYTHYVQQIAGLKNYSDVSAVPLDPYNVSVGLVKRLLGYYDNITLDQSQNATFNQAAALTNDKSWCCCQCWAWYAHAGLAKYMIKDYGYNVSQVVTLINLEDCCGG